MSLFRKKSEYCRKKIDRDSKKRNVRVPGFHGTFNKHFCSEEHINNYEKEAEEHLGKSKGGCCG